MRSMTPKRFCAIWCLSRIPVPASLGSDGLGVFSTSDIPAFDPNTVDLPPLLSLSASNPGRAATATQAAILPSDPTSVIMPLVDSSRSAWPTSTRPPTS
jgi:hypothetical protein